MSAVSFNGEVVERMNCLRYLEIHFDRMLMYKAQIESTKLKCKKALSMLKAMASKGIERHHLFLLYQSVRLSIIDYGLVLATLSQSNLLKLDRVQKEAMSHSGNNKRHIDCGHVLPAGPAIHGNKT